ncbi:hypothetical protein Bbelb_289950 [Branchiostoma belcheri]|nr:hypothetical protein Bbelb_289950 [Branchiostoma belcheri]
MSEDLRLVGGNRSYEGRVEVAPWWNEPWGTVCDDHWDLHDAEVVCRQLGYNGAWEAPIGAYFGPGTGKIWLDDVSCNGHEVYLSDCPHNGWEEHNCQHSEDAGVVCAVECSTYCQNGGTCMNFVCVCPPGYTGGVCQIEINECSGSPCTNGGNCRDEVNGFTCECAPGWDGVRCEHNIDECSSNPCMNGGICIDVVNGYSCDCTSSYTGLRCENGRHMLIKVDGVNVNQAYCDSNPCINGGTCENGRCVCPPGFQGHRCQLDIDECISSPCLNNGECVNEVPGYTCHCPPGYTGARCGLALYNDTCYWFSPDSQTHQVASTTCHDMEAHLVDVKEPHEQRWLGDQTPGVSEWTSLRTSVHPTFVYSDGTHVSDHLQWTSKGMYSPYDTCVFLDSTDGFTAMYAPCTEQHNYICESHIDECASSPCLNGGTCVGLAVSFRCVCPDPFTGDRCETARREKNKPRGERRIKNMQAERGKKDGGIGNMQAERGKKDGGIGNMQAERKERRRDRKYAGRERKERRRDRKYAGREERKTEG